MSTEVDTAALDMKSFVTVFNAEANAAKRINGHLDTIEEIFFEPDVLFRLSTRPDRLMALYKILMERKDIAQKFMVKIAELGIKSDFLKALSEGEVAPRQGSRPSLNTRKAVALLREAMGEKLAEGASDEYETE